MRALPPEWKEEFERLRAERDEAQRELRDMRQSIERLSSLVAGQNDKLDQLVSMLRRREAQLARSEREVRKLRRKLGLDDPDPEPVAEDVPGEHVPDPGPPAEGKKKAKSTRTPKASADEPVQADPKPRARSRGGRRPPPDHLPAETEKHEVAAVVACSSGTF